MGFLEFDEVEQPQMGPRIYPKDAVNHLVMVWAIDYVAHSPTRFNDGSDPKKPADAIVVDVVDLDQIGEDRQLGMLARTSWWRQARLIQTLRPRIGKPRPLLARIVKEVAAMGATSAFTLVDMSTDERARAMANQWWAAHPGFEPSKPFGTPGETRPAAEPSPLEVQATGSLGGSVTMRNLQDMAQQARFEDKPPF